MGFSPIRGQFVGPVNLASLCVVLLALSCGACSQLQSEDLTVTRAVPDTLALSEPQLGLIATDLVTALVQVRTLSPFTTTLQVSDPPNAFGRAVHLALEYGGYGLQTVDSDQGTNYLSYASRTSMNEGGKVTDYIITVGDVSIRRAYDRRNNVLLPVSAMYVRGADPAHSIQLNDTIFLQQSAELSFDNRVNLETSPIAGAVTANQPADELSTPAPQNYDQESALLWAQNLLLDKHDNAVTPDLSRHAPMQRTEIEFFDSSMFLGLGNKRAIESLVKVYEPDTDLFYLIACAADQSVSSATLAQSQRVLEEFLLHGVSEDAIFNKPCNVTDRSVSRNGDAVIVLLYRKNR